MLDREASSRHVVEVLSVFVTRFSLSVCDEVFSISVCDEVFSQCL